MNIYACIVCLSSPLPEPYSDPSLLFQIKGVMKVQFHWAQKMETSNVVWIATNLTYTLLMEIQKTYFGETTQKSY